MTGSINNIRRILKIAGTVTGFVVFIAGCATVGQGQSSGEGDGASAEVQPDPGLSPQEVVAIQLHAFGSSDGENDGIAVAYRFASPSNREVTGPEERFAGMMRTPAYRIMLEYERIEYAPVIIAGAAAMQRVILFNGDEVAVFDFFLRRQSVEPYLDCWMTEGVTRLQLPQQEPPGLPSAPEVLTL
jgi:hypothetical protein